MTKDKRSLVSLRSHPLEHICTSVVGRRSGVTVGDNAAENGYIKGTITGVRVTQDNEAITATISGSELTEFSPLKRRPHSIRPKNTAGQI